MITLELLSPAKNFECGKAAIDHGADAVYIGAGRFGARAAAGNNLDDIAELCTYAHRFFVKVYVTLNTILYDDELEDCYKLIRMLEHIGVDAIIIQDTSLIGKEGSMSLHASTQMDNRDSCKIRKLHEYGFSRAVLARELSITEISRIHTSVPEIELEAFVHGALCVSYSGLCYASQACFNRSANRGECAQFCRLKFDLIDAAGELVEKGKYLLSLKDMNRSEHLFQLIEAGVTSFKIEGRLKDVAYVKNVTAAYSRCLDEIIKRYPTKYCRASKGVCKYSFEPNLSKTFNRGYTTYFIDGKRTDIHSLHTPKSIGEYVGTVKEVRGNSFNVSTTSTFSNGDGICFINKDGQLEGFRVNKVSGNRLYPFKMPLGIHSGVILYRNYDKEFENMLEKQTAIRKIPLKLKLYPILEGFILEAFCIGEESISVSFDAEHEVAHLSQRDNIVKQLSKLGNTIFECTDVELPDEFNYFIPSSILSDARRRIVEKLENRNKEIYEQARNIKSNCSNSMSHTVQSNKQPNHYKHSCFYNIANSTARRFYESKSMKGLSPAYEIVPVAEAPIMQCRYCIKYALGYCTKQSTRKTYWKEPLFLLLPDGRRFRLSFDCKLCNMQIYKV